jgi:hypothetical protein
LLDAYGNPRGPNTLQPFFAHPANGLTDAIDSIAAPASHFIFSATELAGLATALYNLQRFGLSGDMGEAFR